MLKRAQRRFMRMTPVMKDLTYNDRLSALSIWMLKEHKNRADLIEVFKIVKGFSASYFDNFLEINQEVRTRGHLLTRSFAPAQKNCQQTYENTFSQRE